MFGPKYRIIKEKTSDGNTWFSCQWRCFFWFTMQRTDPNWPLIYCAASFPTFEAAQDYLLYRTGKRVIQKVFGVQS